MDEHKWSCIQKKVDVYTKEYSDQDLYVIHDSSETCEYKGSFFNIKENNLSNNITQYFYVLRYLNLSDLFFHEDCSNKNTNYYLNISPFSI